jgi:hypothetical protein
MIFIFVAPHVPAGLGISSPRNAYKRRRYI